MTRPTKDETWLNIAKELSRQSTCLRRAVGCVLIDRYGAILATGWNGVAPNQLHCNEKRIVLHAAFAVHADSPDRYDTIEYPHSCPGATAPSGTSLDSCRAAHAEANAVATCRLPFDIETCYCTSSPCVSCIKSLLRTSCRRVVFLEEYPAPLAKEYWLATPVVSILGVRTWERFSV